MPTTKKVLIVDDSALVREMLSDLIESTDDLELMDSVRSGEAALRFVKNNEPDVISLDLEMPGLSGLETLRQLIPNHPIPVIMVSAFTQSGAELTQQSLELGALDFVAKPKGMEEFQGDFRRQYLNKIRNLASADVQRILRIRNTKTSKSAATTESRVAIASSTDIGKRCIAIGISTGGPPALTRLFESLKPPFPPTLVVQHMPKNFTRAFAKRLDDSSSLQIQEASNAMTLKPNQVYIAPGGQHMGLKRVGAEMRISVFAGPTVSSHRPSVDVMMRHVGKYFGNQSVGVIMTGMGRDGVEGCKLLKEHGAYIFGQDEESSDVYGMNKIAFTSGHVDQQFHLNELPKLLVKHVGQM